MTNYTQLDGSIGISPAESAFGTDTTVTKFIEPLSDSSLAWDPTFVQGQGQRQGTRLALAARRGIGRQQAQVSVNMEAQSSGLGAFLKAALGTVTNTVTSDAGVFQQVHTLLGTDYLESYTIQGGVPMLGANAIKAHTIPGCVCSTFELDVTNAGIVTVKTTWLGKEVKTDTAYATPSYASSPETFLFTSAALTLGGTVTAPTTTALATGGTAAANVRDFSLTIDNHLDDGGFNIGGGGKRARKPAVGMAEIKGKLTAEFDAVTLRDAYLNQTNLPLVLTLTGTSTIGSTSHPVLQAYIPTLRLEGELPNFAGGDVITQSIDFTGLDGLVSSTSPLYLVYVTADTAP